MHALLHITEREAPKEDKQGPPGHVRTGPWWSSLTPGGRSRRKDARPLPVNDVNPTAAGQAALDLEPGERSFLRLLPCPNSLAAGCGEEGKGRDNGKTKCKRLESPLPSRRQSPPRH